MRAGRVEIMDSGYRRMSKEEARVAGFAADVAPILAAWSAPFAGGTGR